MLGIFVCLAKETIAFQQLRKLISLHVVVVVVVVVLVVAVVIIVVVVVVVVLVVVYYTYPQIVDILHNATMYLQLLQLKKHY
jgi:hypothetical protein